MQKLTFAVLKKTPTSAREESKVFNKLVDYALYMQFMKEIHGA